MKARTPTKCFGDAQPLSVEMIHGFHALYGSARMSLARWGVLLLMSMIASLAAMVPTAHATDQVRLVTIAARECPSYTSITANRARNNIQESLETSDPTQLRRRQCAEHRRPGT